MKEWQPRAKTCAGCGEGTPTPKEVKCGRFGYLVDRKLAKKQAVCRTDGDD